VRDGKWKLVSNFNEPWELYDLEADRTELNDLAAAQPGHARELTAKYEAWATRVGVKPWPFLSPSPQKNALPPKADIRQ
jgi:arylsulfatase A-like enzyme